MSLTKVTFSMIDGEVINVLDYGAYNNNTNAAATRAAIQAALDAANNSTPKKVVYLPEGTYAVDDSLVLYDYQIVRGAGWRRTVISGNLPNKSIIRTQYGENPTYDQRTIGWDLAEFQVNANSAANSIGFNYGNVGYCNAYNLGAYNATYGVKCTQRTYYACFINFTIQACYVCAYLQSDGGANEFINPNFGFDGGTDCGGVKIISGSWKFNGGTVDTNTTSNSFFFSVGQDGYGTTASIQISNVYIEGVSNNTNQFRFYNNVITTNIFGLERRGYVGPDSYTDTAVQYGIFNSGLGNANPAGYFTKQIAFTRNPATAVIDGGIKSLEGGTLAVINQTLDGPGNMSVGNLPLFGTGYTGAGIYSSTSNPEGVIQACAGSICVVNTAGGTGSVGSTYKKTSGTGNTGWVAL